MIKHLLLSTLFFITALGYSQTVTIKGIVLDTDGIPVPNSRYYPVNKPEAKKLTSVDGQFTLRYDVESKDSIRFEHVGFEPVTMVITSRMIRKARDGVIKLTVTLPDRMFTDIVVRPELPDTLFGTQEYSIADFAFHSSGNLVLLTYDKTLAKNSVLRLLDSNNRVLDVYYVGEDALELQQDFKSNIHLISEEKVHLVVVENNRFNVLLENRDYYFRYVAPVIDTIGENIYFSNYSEVYPAFDYLEFNRKDSVYNKMLVVEDELMMELYRSEFKYVDVRTKLWAANKQIETGIDKEIWVGATVFTNSLYYEPLYAPLFKVGHDTVLVFDHYKNLMFRYSPEIGFTDSVRISYHKESRKSGWEQPLIQDDENDKIYGLFLRNGYTYLSEIDQTNGQILHSFKLHYKYVEKIQIAGDYVYYIYRPFESVQKKYIYREKLKV